jgi:hypothetical protein
MASPAPPTPTAMRWAFDAILAVVAVLIFVLLYLLLPGNDHVGALLAIGSFALLFGLVAYIGRALSSSPGTAQAWSWGFAGLGFGILFLTLGLAPASTMSSVDRVLGLILVFVALAVVVAAVGWRWRVGVSHDAETKERAAWAAQPPKNALDYPTAGAPPAPKEGTPR